MHLNASQTLAPLTIPDLFLPLGAEIERPQEQY